MAQKGLSSLMFRQFSARLLLFCPFDLKIPGSQSNQTFISPAFVQCRCNILRNNDIAFRQELSQERGAAVALRKQRNLKESNRLRLSDLQDGKFRRQVGTVCTLCLLCRSTSFNNAYIYMFIVMAANIQRNG